MKWTSKGWQCIEKKYVEIKVTDYAWSLMPIRQMLLGMLIVVVVVVPRRQKALLKMFDQIK